MLKITRIATPPMAIPTTSPVDTLDDELDGVDGVVDDDGGDGEPEDDGGGGDGVVEIPVGGGGLGVVEADGGGGDEAGDDALAGGGGERDVDGAGVDGGGGEATGATGGGGEEAGGGDEAGGGGGEVDGGCCIHDLLHDLCIKKAKEDKFLEVLGHDCSSLPLNSRRLGLHSNILKHVSSNPSATKFRSILCFGLDERQLSLNEWKLLYKSFPLLRVLDVWGVGVEAIPNEIDKLIHQRYLRLKSLTAQTLPASICNLWNLQTLEVIAPCIDRPRIDIWKMQELRHLYFHGQAVLPEPPILKAKDSSANVLSNLLTLSCISPDSCRESVFSMLPNLLKLGINGDLEEHRMKLTFVNLSKLNCLQTLKLERDRRCEELMNLRHGIKFPPNLTKLTLLETQLLEDPMGVLGRLPNLQVLKLKNAAYGGRNLCCPGNGFPKLQVLKLVNLAIRCWTISKGSMPSLRSVVINRCGNLEGLPSALPNIPAFEELELWSPHVSLVKEAKEIEMSQGKEKFKLVIYQS